MVNFSVVYFKDVNNILKILYPEKQHIQNFKYKYKENIYRVMSYYKIMEIIYKI